MNNKHTRSKRAAPSASALLLGALVLASVIPSLPAWAAAPQLKIALDDQGVTIDWPLPEGNWALESSATAAGRFAPVPQSPTITNDRYEVAVPATDQAQFFRLSQLSSQVEIFHQGQTLGGAPLHGMNGITKDAAGRLYIASVFGREIVVLDPADGAFIERLGPAQGVLFPDDVAFGPDGSLYWTDIAVGQVGRRAPDGTVTKQFVAPGVNPITFSADGRLFVGLAFYGDALWELDPLLQEPPQLVLEAPGQLNAFSFGPDGQLYSPSNTRRTLVRIDVDAKTLTPIGALNRSISAVKFDAAQRLWLHSEGDLLRVNRETGAIEQTIALGTMRADNFVPAAEDRFYVSGPGGLLEVTMDGTIRQIRPGGMRNPGGLAVVRQGDKEVLVVADLQSMYEFDAATGALLETHESNFMPPPGVSTLLGPMTVSASPAGVVVSTWIFPSAGQNVQEYDLGAETVLRQVIVTNTPINAIEFQGKLVVAEIASGSVAQFSGDERTVLASGLFVPAGLAASADALYVGDWASGLIFQLAAAGAPLNPPRIVTAGLKNPEGMALDASGNLLVVETGSRSLVRVNTTTGQIATVAAGLDLGPPVPAPGFPPTYMFDGVAVASSGAIYVTGYGANVIYRITEESIGAPSGWVRIPTAPATTPAARAWHGMVYDSARRVVLLHGGLSQSGQPALADTWSWDGKNWAQLTQQGPAALTFGFAFDSDRGVAVLHGGLGTGPFPRPPLGATWEWDGQTWNQVSLNTGPGIRVAPAMAYDPKRQRVLLHGGASDHGGNTVFADTWEWDGTAWVEIPDANGPARGLHAMAYDERRQVMVLFGGFDVLGSGPVDTWEFDGTQWRQAATDGPPGVRALPILTYDPLRQAILLFGGGDYPPYGGPDYEYRNDVWEWNGSAWSEISVEGTLPTPVIAAAGAYDPRRGRLVQFGGATVLPDFVPTNDTWEYGLMP